MVENAVKFLVFVDFDSIDIIVNLKDFRLHTLDIEMGEKLKK